MQMAHWGQVAEKVQRNELEHRGKKMRVSMQKNCPLYDQCGCSVYELLWFSAVFTVWWKIISFPLFSSKFPLKMQTSSCTSAPRGLELKSKYGPFNPLRAPFLLQLAPLSLLLLQEATAYRRAYVLHDLKTVSQSVTEGLPEVSKAGPCKLQLDHSNSNKSRIRCCSDKDLCFMSWK